MIEPLKDLYQNGSEEPLARQLLREARSLRSSNPRAALVIGVSAAEVGVKKLIGFLVPHAQWLVDELQTPPLTKMLRQYLPSLPVKKGFTGKALSPPNELLNVLDDAVKARNKVIHVGIGPPNYTELGEMLDAVGDLLWVCDIYSGHAWPAEFISYNTISKWKSAQSLRS
jgi:hypothetical protein